MPTARRGNKLRRWRWRILQLATHATLWHRILLDQACAAELDWQAPPSCPAREVIERRVRDAIGVPLDQAANIHFVCSVTKTRSGSFRLELRIGVPSDGKVPTPRIIEASSCDQVADTSAVAIALALGADLPETQPGGSDVRNDRASSPPAEPAVATSDQPKAADKSSPAQVKPVSAASHLWLAARLGPSFDLGSLPGIAPGISTAFALGYREASLLLSGTVFGGKRTTLGDGTGGDFSLWTAALLACGSSPRERAHGSICGGAELGQMKGIGVGAVINARQRTAWWVTPRIDLEVTSAPLLLGMRTYLGAMVGLPLTRRTFTLGSGEEVYRADTTVWRLNAGLEIDWR